MLQCVIYNSGFIEMMMMHLQTRKVSCLGEVLPIRGLNNGGGT